MMYNMNTEPTSLHPDELIAQARELDADDVGVLGACETFYLHGLADESSGDVEAPTGYFYRVNRWIVQTDSGGFHELDEHGSVEDAERDFAYRRRQYARWNEG